MGKVAAALGLGTSFEVNGKTYSLSPWTYKIQGEFEKYLERKAVEAFQAVAPLMTPEERAHELKALRQEITGGEYSFGSDAVAKALNSVVHLTYLFYLMLRPNHPEMTLELAGELVSANMADAMAKIAEANADPSTATQESPG